ncbi:hypothetical protein FNF27_05629 [Cafeteria roenbergensis]|uniref:Uncharacterized protein n=3 Tax=Cafeteria roenbergensis TaxID=33653 RepID=A0A5A8DJP5_CAFRO|nr:hypothetical protein FNF29_04827 [Cafeteria roenbergensis]KAA0164884.1 hypothetical protein FNF31_02207 [Cafeteria roenbergensis]KAA0172875.1 hypothetical protein FNF27_05629 [Cafeteria roenbergensis]|eukprot:KAA0151135.1 hypothetical protein FNF29_04827 [Cafeteria roenbergensis]
MSIASRGVATVTAAELAGTGARGSTRRAPQLRAVNQTQDIAGATSKRLMGRFGHNRSDFYGTGDIEGAAPSNRLSREVRKESTINRTDDIDGARPSRRTFRTSRRVNPLDPQYDLPAAPARPVTPPRFVRDAMDNTDIAGAQAPVPASQRPVAARRAPTDVSDIPGAVSRALREQDKPPPRDILGAKAVDAPAVQRHFRSHRHTDPLRPCHVIYGAVVEDDAASRPRAAINKAHPPRQSGSLRTDDIEGARPGWRPPHSGAGSIPDERRRQFRDPTNTADVAGAQASTLKRGMRTRRVTDPNDRIYASLDGRPAMPRAAADGEGGAATWLSKASVSGGVAPGTTTLRLAGEPHEPPLERTAQAAAMASQSAAADEASARLSERVALMERRAAARAEAWRLTKRGTDGSVGEGPAGGPSGPASVSGSRGGGSRGSARGIGLQARAESEGTAGTPAAFADSARRGGMAESKQEAAAQPDDAGLSRAVDSALASARRDSARSGLAGASSTALGRSSGLVGPPAHGLPLRGDSPRGGSSSLGARADARSPRVASPPASSEVRRPAASGPDSGRGAWGGFKAGSLSGASSRRSSPRASAGVLGTAGRTAVTATHGEAAVASGGVASSVPRRGGRPSKPTPRQDAAARAAAAAVAALPEY